MPTGGNLYNQNEISEYRKIFDHYYDGVRNFVYYKTGNVDLSDDIVQEVFLKVWNMRDQIKKETIKALLYTMAENMAKNHFRHQQVVYSFANNYEPSEMPEEADFELRQQEFHRHLQKTLADIPEKARVVFLMNRIEGLTYAEIAGRLNLSVKAIEKRMSEAIAIVREKIKYKI